MRYYSPEHQARLKSLNGSSKASEYAATVSAIVDKLQISHLLDYGCGKLALAEALTPEAEFTYQAYDPAFERFAGEPIPAEMVCVVNVLECVEPRHLDDVLDHLESLTECIIFCAISTGESEETLADGLNANLTQQPAEWWLPKLWSRFSLQTFQVTGPEEFIVIGNNPAVVFE